MANKKEKQALKATAQSSGVAEQLNQLLAAYQIFYINTRGFHWNIRGEKFFELHAKFEELYTDALVKIDEIAERILTIGHTPLHSFSDYLRHSSIDEITGVSDSQGTMTAVVDGFRRLLAQEKDILQAAQKAEDEGTAALMSDYIREQEKLLWMFNAYLN
jgi:starvation-inducible DNA-binding protein